MLVEGVFGDDAVVDVDDEVVAEPLCESTSASSPGAIERRSSAARLIRSRSPLPDLGVDGPCGRLKRGDSLEAAREEDIGEFGALEALDISSTAAVAEPSALFCNARLLPGERDARTADEPSHSHESERPREDSIRIS
jgi:hypothetical protein